MGVAWPGDDWAIPALIVGFAITALVTVQLSRLRGSRVAA
jgi:hypothetical protein